ncbi:MAG: aminopeptidase, partial [Bryobacterales bacterium]|nr:aminopeptidase [Bryobacterales bacterium]
MSTNLSEVSFDPELQPGAHNAVFVCLRIQPFEKVTVITDHACQEIAASLVTELETCGCRYRAFVLEELAPRPLVDMPQAVLEDMETSDVSIFAARAQPNELHTRMQMTDVVNRRKMRHAHMVNIERRIMLEGMRADFMKVDELSVRVMNIVTKARKIRAVTPAGTSIEADLSPDHKWLKTSGIISPNKWGNLPGGEVFTSPGEVNGTFVIDGVV